MPKPTRRNVNAGSRKGESSRLPQSGPFRSLPQTWTATGTSTSCRRLRAMTKSRGTRTPMGWGLSVRRGSSPPRRTGLHRSSPRTSMVTVTPTFCRRHPTTTRSRGTRTRMGWGLSVGRGSSLPRRTMPPRFLPQTWMATETSTSFRRPPLTTRSRGTRTRMGWGLSVRRGSSLPR